MEEKIYNKNNLLNVHSEETRTWIGKVAKVTLKDGSIIKGVVKEIGYAINTNEDEGIAEHLWVNLLIGGKNISVTNLELLEI